MDNLHQRDRVGVDDFVLLENHQDRDSFLRNLQKRFTNNIIYTYIGQVLVSVNPYRELPIYNEEYVKNYQNVNFYQLSPHIFAIADTSFRVMVDECRDQCILISGESGSGKTVASKKILQYISDITDSIYRDGKIKHINNKLLYSNPVLEAFGNAKTSHNNNSSRFGKYMDIEFDYIGSPTGGHINIYLLEKSRVVFQAKNEQNFHIFYQLLRGIDEETLQRLHLKRDPQDYFYLNQNDNRIELPGEQNHFNVIQDAFKMFEFSQEEQDCIFSIIASILHLGNVGFFDEEDGKTIISNMKSVTFVCNLLNCDQTLLRNALVNRTIEARDEFMTTNLTRDQAIYARDALAKAIYERLFVWLVDRLNDSLASKIDNNNNMTRQQKVLIGLLDIYGFEIFERNNFEQFCINYCNEKLQQLFIELTLKQEQEEYKREQIEWEPVKYFNNKIICDLIEEKHKGIIAFLDEECLRPGDTSDMTLLQKLNSNLASNPHYSPVNYLGKNRSNGVEPKQFKIAHYAGDVIYDIEGFIDKNNDQLYRDLKRTMCSSKNLIIKQLFHADELSIHKRPTTIATQFRQSLSNLMNLLASKEPWYIRCIKPNDSQRPGIFNEQLVRHQIQYLGLMENLRVRRAGFAYRRNYNDFLERYKCLCPNTWPYYKGSFRNGVQKLIEHFGLDENEYKMGLSKIFIRSPQTLFRIEDAFQQHKNVLATQIQALYKGYRQKKIYQNIRSSVISLQANVRRYLAIKELQRRKWASFVIRNFIKGFITRNNEPNDYNRKFLNTVKVDWLKSLKENLPSSILSDFWPRAPVCCQQASELLKSIHKKWLARKYVLGITQQRKEILMEKVLAEKLFKNKKISYLQSVPEVFESNRLDPKMDELRKKIFELKFKSDDEKTKYCTMVNKYDRHGYMLRPRMLILTNKKLYLLDPKNMTLKESIGLNTIKVVTTNRNDGLFVVKIPIQKKEKGDLILEYHPRLIELLTILIKNAGEDKLIITDSNIVEHSMANGKKGQIHFVDGIKYEIFKRKDGFLQVSSTKCLL